MLMFILSLIASRGSSINFLRRNVPAVDGIPDYFPRHGQDVDTEVLAFYLLAKDDVGERIKRSNVITVDNASLFHSLFICWKERDLSLPSSKTASSEISIIGSVSRMRMISGKKVLLNVYIKTE